MKTLTYIIVAILLITVGVIGCDNGVAPSVAEIDPDQEFGLLKSDNLVLLDEPAPPLLVEVSVGPETLEFWPYTGTNFSGAPQDPINLIFFGQADPRDIRAALMGLDGNRAIPGLPPVPPFNSVWTDGIGDIQAGYCTPEGWSGSVVQLECGDHTLVRFHLRLFQLGQWTVGNGHIEVMIPGTSEHQVLSWELAEQFIVYDFLRSGLLDPDFPVIPTNQINDAPFRSIPTYVYNELPLELRMLTGGPIADVTEDVPIATDGHAMILNLAQAADRVAGETVQDFTITYDIAMPKPFCASGPGDFVYVSGPVHLRQVVEQTDGGPLTMNFIARGELSVTPINPFTGEPIGETMTAFVRQQHRSMMNDSHFDATGVLYQRLGKPNDPAGGLLFSRLCVKSDGQCGYNAILECNSDAASAPAAACSTPAGPLMMGRD